MKKVTAVLLSAIMLLICSVISSNAADKPIFQTDIVHGNPGEIVEVSLDLLNNPGITALSIDVDYPTNDLELTEVKGCGLFSDAISTGDIKINPLRISWYASDSQNKTDSGTLAKLYFRILGNASLSRVNISYNPENVFNNALQNQTFSIKNGWVLAGDAKIGDTNGDGSVNISDATEVQKHLAQLLTLSGDRLKAADADGDGVVNISDATHIQKYLAQLIDHLG